MAEPLRCKSCGCVIEAGRVRAVCPACGVPRKMMESWRDPVSRRRRLLLWLDIHPIIDHFSISFAACSLVLVLFALLFPWVYRETATGILRGFVGVLPVAVLASFISGLFDGRIRFRRTTTPLLKKKQLLGALFFAATAAAAVLTFAVGPFVTWVRIVNAVLLAGGVICAVGLTRIGRGLLSAISPG